jgi:hypothetical protein
MFQSDPQKSAFIVPSKTEEFLHQQQQQQQQQHLYGGADMGMMDVNPKFGNPNLDYGFRYKKCDCRKKL